MKLNAVYNTILANIKLFCEFLTFASSTSDAKLDCKANIIFKYFVIYKKSDNNSAPDLSFLN